MESVQFTKSVEWFFTVVKQYIGNLLAFNLALDESVKSDKTRTSLHDLFEKYKVGSPRNGWTGVPLIVAPRLCIKILMNNLRAAIELVTSYVNSLPENLNVGMFGPNFHTRCDFVSSTMAAIIRSLNYGIAYNISSENDAMETLAFHSNLPIRTTHMYAPDLEIIQKIVSDFCRETPLSKKEEIVIMNGYLKAIFDDIKVINGNDNFPEMKDVLPLIKDYADQQNFLKPRKLPYRLYQIIAEIVSVRISFVGCAD